MTTAWSHLPNAKHIDRILSDIKANPAKWNAAIDDAWETASDAAYNAAYNAASDAAQNAIYYAISDAAYNAARNAASDAALTAAAFTAAWNAILALIAYDDYAYLLDEKPEDVEILALLGNPAAILLYPTCLALQKEKELV